MNVLHLISSEGHYGAEAMLVTLASMQKRCAHEATVAVFADRRRPPVEVAQVARKHGLTVEPLECNGRWDPAVAGRIQRQLDEHSIDVLHTHGYKADFYGRRAAKDRALPLVSTCHNWPDKRPLMRAYAVLDRWILRDFDKVVAVSEPVAKLLRRSGLPPGKVSVVTNGVDLERFETAAPAVRLERHWGDRPVVGFVGRLVEGKGGQVLLDAAHAVLRTFRDALFVFAGEGPSRQAWCKQARQLGIGDYVEFLGARKDMPQFYASIDMLVLPSFDEAAPMSVLEAMAAGKPVVASRVGALPALVTPATTGALVEPGDAKGLASAIQDLLRDAKAASELGRNGRELVRSKFSAQAMTASYLGVYLEALGRHA